MLNDATCFEHIYIALGYTDLRSGIDRIVAIIKNDFELDPYDKESIFLFCGRRTDRIKAIVFEEAELYFSTNDLQMASISGHGRHTKYRK